MMWIYYLSSLSFLQVFWCLQKREKSATLWRSEGILNPPPFLASSRCVCVCDWVREYRQQYQLISAGIACSPCILALNCIFLKCKLKLCKKSNFGEFLFPDVTVINDYCVVVCWGANFYLKKNFFFTLYHFKKARQAFFFHLSAQVLRKIYLIWDF